MLWQHSLRASGVCCSAAAVAERAPYDEEENPSERQLHPLRRAARPPAKPSDEIHPKICRRCGLVPCRTTQEARGLHRATEMGTRIEGAQGLEKRESAQAQERGGGWLV
jgi:hypothetical protein